jgi:protein disulfide-isomerase/protein disulfide-isomerase A1
MNKAAVIEGPPLEPTNKPVIVLRAPAKAEWFDSFADGARQEGAFFFVNDAANTITMQHQGEDVQTLKEPDEAKLKTFFDENKMPMVGELNGDTFENYTKSDKGLIWFLFKHAEGQLQEAKKDNLDLMLKVARHEHVHGKLSVTFTDTIQFAQAVEGMLGVTEFPAVVIQKKAGGKQKFQFEGVGPAGEMDADKIVAYIKDVMDEKIKPKLKSEPKPAEQGDVKVVVGETLMEMVFDEKKDVLFEVYAPWCGHCKKLEPEYEMLAKKVTKDADDLITIAKMDGTANDSPTDDIDWSGFPTMKYIKAGSKVVGSYEGGRTAKDMWAWIRENSTHKDEITKRLADKYADESKHDEL